MNDGNKEKVITLMMMKIICKGVKNITQ